MVGLDGGKDDRGLIRRIFGLVLQSLGKNILKEILRY